jgi:phage shock protein PspC (stress-responsive transcriptional regulator)
VNSRRLYRSSDDRILAGVAGGVANYFDVDPVIVRIIWFLSVFFTGSLTFWAYLVMIIVVPLEPAEWPPESPWARGGAPGGFTAGYTPPAGPVDTAPGGAAGASPSGDAQATPDGSAAFGAGAPPVGTAPTPGMPPAPPAGPGAGWPNDWRSQRRQDRWQRRADRWQQRTERFDGRRDRGPGLIFGLFLILVGGLLAWHQLDPRIDLSLSWPVVIIAFGVILVGSSIRWRDRT